MGDDGELGKGRFKFKYPCEKIKLRKKKRDA